MSELIWINGEISPMAEATIGVEDRGFQFADGVYEVVRIYSGRPFALTEHLERLERSAGGIVLSLPMDAAKLKTEIEQFITRVGPTDAMLYLQLTRGVAGRNHAFPTQSQATLLFYVRELPPVAKPGEGNGTKLMTVPDERWRRCWIKSIALLPNVLAKNVALAAGADEAAFVENGLVSECSASNLFLIKDNQLITAPVGSNVLPGITRMLLLKLAPETGLEVVERPVQLPELFSAAEVFITSTIRELSWVSRVDGRSIGEGRCGAVTASLHREFVRQRCASV